MPTSPPVVYTPPSPGGSPTNPRSVYEPAPAGLAILVITDVATSGINGQLVYCGLINSVAAWSTDGTQTAGASNSILEYISGTSWRLSRGSSYSATKVSGAAPNGLTGWTVGTGSGSPTVTALAATTPAAITA